MQEVEDSEVLVLQPQALLSSSLSASARLFLSLGCSFYLLFLSFVTDYSDYNRI